jgi:hypothetical protein
MKKPLIILSLCLSLFASSDKIDDNKKVPEKCSDEKVLISQMNTVYQSGCCSHHGGVSGCSSGTVVCSDGWLSSCSCLGGMPVDKSIKNQ